MMKVVEIREPVAQEHQASFAAGYIKGSITAENIKTGCDRKKRYYVGAFSGDTLCWVWLSMEDMTSLLRQGETLLYINANGDTIELYVV